MSELVLPDSVRIGAVVAEFNSFITDSLREAALAELSRHGVGSDDVATERVPGAWEIPVALQAMAASGQFDALVAIGCVVRGATPHFDYVCAECASGVTRVSLDFRIPIGVGVLTVDTIEQALERAGSSGSNKGAEAAHAALGALSVTHRYPAR